MSWWWCVVGDDDDGDRWCYDDDDGGVGVVVSVAVARVKESECRDRRDPLMGRIFGVGRKTHRKIFWRPEMAAGGSLVVAGGGRIYLREREFYKFVYAAESVSNAIRFEYYLASSSGWTKSSILWVEIGETSLIGPELVQDTTDKVVLIKEKLKAARDRQKRRLKTMRITEADDHEFLELPNNDRDPYVETALQALPSPDFVPGPEEPEHAPPKAD
ncbi:hypothetical protein Tco_1245993 [Tanacetum coccineum]